MPRSISTMSLSLVRGCFSSRSSSNSDSGLTAFLPSFVPTPKEFNTLEALRRPKLTRPRCDFVGAFFFFTPAAGALTLPEALPVIVSNLSISCTTQPIMPVVLSELKKNLCSADILTVRWRDNAACGRRCELILPVDTVDYWWGFGVAEGNNLTRWQTWEEMCCQMEERCQETVKVCHDKDIANSLAIAGEVLT